MQINELIKKVEQAILPSLDKLSSEKRNIFRNKILAVTNKEALEFEVEKLNEILPIGDVVSIVLMEFEKNKRIQKFQEKIQEYSNKRNLIQKFLEVMPLYYDKSKNWWIWNHSEFMWELVDETDIINSVNIKTNINTLNSRERNEIIEGLKQEGRLMKPKEVPKDWIQFKNKLIDITSGKIITASPKYFATNPIPIKIGESEDTPTMDKIFEEWVGEDYVKTLYEIIAYCLLPDYPINRLFCFVGGGMNGKSKYLELISRFIGVKNVTSTELDTLLDSRFEITRTYKKLICQLGETNFNEMKKTAILKKLTGGDLIGYEHKGKDPFHDYNYAKILISTNNLPTTTDKTVGFYRRWMIIDFPNQFSEKKDILKDVPEEEYNNLAKKSIRILKELLDKREFHNEGTIEERTKKFEDRSNPFEKFWQEMVEEDADGHIFKFEFKKELELFLKENKFRALSDRMIHNHMKDKGIESQKVATEWHSNQYENKRYHAWIGIKLKVSMT